MIRCFLILGAFLQVPCQEKVFRFDYEFSSQAGGWLKFHVIPGTWQEAALLCHAEGAVLASPLNKQLKSAMVSFVGKHKNSVPTTIFTGVHATFSKGDYSSVEGVPLLRLEINWAPGEPDNFDNAESCLAMVTDSRGSMSDVSCEELLPYVCFKKDTHLIMSECGTTDPGYLLEARTGSCYKLHTRHLIWSEAYMTCAAEGGYLVIINSEAEANVVKNYFGSIPVASNPSEELSIAVGFHDVNVHNNFMTIHGETIASAGYQNWRKKSPDNGTNAQTGDYGEFCGSIYGDGQMNDLHCNYPTAFLCEKSPSSLLQN